MKKWQIQEAKAKLSELIKKAAMDGPQEISIRGKAAAVVLSTEQYITLTSPKSSFVQFLQNSPLFGIELDLERNKDLCRKVEL